MLGQNIQIMDMIWKFLKEDELKGAKMMWVKKDKSIIHN